MGEKRNRFNFISSLAIEYAWLNDKLDPLEALLFDECKTQEEVDVVCDIISVFKFIDRNEYMGLINLLVESIVSCKGHQDSNTQVVAMAADANADSSQQVIYYLKSKFQEKGWEEHLLVNTFGGSYRAFKNRGRKHYNLVLVDDFIGSGKTANSRIDALKRIYEEAGIVGINFKVRVLVATKIGVDFLTEKGIDVGSEIVIDKAIDDNFCMPEASRRRGIMKRIEQELSSEYRGRKMPSLGYSESQAAYYIEDSNASNNLFPIFWWPVSCTEDKRLTMLYRASGDA